MLEADVRLSSTGSKEAFREPIEREREDWLRASESDARWSQTHELANHCLALNALDGTENAEDLTLQAHVVMDASQAICGEKVANCGKLWQLVAKHSLVGTS